MNINVTLIVQMIVFLALVWFTMKYVWPVIREAMDEREKRIADGLAASDRAEKDLELAQEKASQIIREAREKSNEIVEQANQRANQIVDKAKEDAVAERDRQIQAAEAEIAQQLGRAKEELRTRAAALAVNGAERLLERELNDRDHERLVDQLVAEI